MHHGGASWAGWLAGLGPMAQHKAMFWRAAYHVYGYWLVKHLRNDNEKEALI